MVDIGWITGLINSPSDALLLIYVVFELRFGRIREIRERQDRIIDVLNRFHDDVFLRGGD